ncbi:MAG: 2-oxo acid dehydrogenase subunit E2 [Erysipelotrichia bacterium]|nr:2-oxo acid dehydrogenase subunit E2 [Erysipelotrichia bacterium]
MEKRKKHYLDRADGYYLKDIDSFHNYFAHLNPRRTDCEVCMLSHLDVTKALEYLHMKNENSDCKITFFHLILTVMAKMVYNREKMNRFVAGRRFYQRKKVILSFVAKKKFTDQAEEALMMLHPKQGDNLNSIAHKVSGEVKQARKENNKEYGADAALNTLAKLPRFLMIMVMGVLKWLDKNGLFPESFMRVDPNYSTILLSNLGSIKCDAVYHHLSNFGTNSIVLTIGTIHKEKVLNENAQEEIKDVVNFGITIDERIGDGFYFAKCMKFVQFVLDHPELLDDDVTSIVDYQ